MLYQCIITGYVNYKNFHNIWKAAYEMSTLLITKVSLYGVMMIAVLPSSL